MESCLNPDRWYIYKEDQILGPYSAAEIREALRSGDLDPFDLVARDGSPLRLELVEVDEIFQSNQVHYLASEESLEHKSLSPISIAGAVANTTHIKKNERKDDEPPLVRYLELAAPTAYSPPPLHYENAARNSKPARYAVLPQRRMPPAKQRRFFLVGENKRIVGPTSAQEIQTLYAKGALPRSLMVLKEGSPGKVPLEKFISVYAQAQGLPPGTYAGIGDVNGLGRASYPRPYSSISLSTLLVIILTLLIAATSGYLLYTGQELRWPWKTSISSFLNKPKPPKAKENKPPRRSQTSRPQGVPKPKPAAKAATPSAKPAPAATTPPAKPKPKPKLKSPIIQKTVPAAPISPRYSGAPLPRASLNRKSSSPKSAARPTMPIKQRNLTKPSMAAPLKPAPGPKMSQLLNGQKVNNFGPLKLDRQAIARCQGPCRIAAGAADGTVQLSFFKDVWGPSLLNRSQGAYISGIVNKQGPTTTIILQGVR